MFKDVTSEQTLNPAFREKVKKAMPASMRKRLGKWSEHFDAAKRRADGEGEIAPKGAT